MNDWYGTGANLVKKHYEEKLSRLSKEYKNAATAGAKDEIVNEMGHILDKVKRFERKHGHEINQQEAILEP